MCSLACVSFAPYFGKIEIPFGTHENLSTLLQKNSGLTEIVS